MSLLSSIPCKTISPSAALTSPVIFSQPRGDRTSVSLQPWASHINTPTKNNVQTRFTSRNSKFTLPMMAGYGNNLFNGVSYSLTPLILNKVESKRRRSF